ncbi:hypothetical protein Hamer_G020862, partial [Homarus americanus]
MGRRICNSELKNMADNTTRMMLSPVGVRRRVIRRHLTLEQRRLLRTGLWLRTLMSVLLISLCAVLVIVGMMFLSAYVHQHYPINVDSKYDKDQVSRTKETSRPYKCHAERPPSAANTVSLDFLNPLYQYFDIFENFNVVYVFNLLSSHVSFPDILSLIDQEEESEMDYQEEEPEMVYQEEEPAMVYQEEIENRSKSDDDLTLLNSETSRSDPVVLDTSDDEMEERKVEGEFPSIRKVLKLDDGSTSEVVIDQNKGDPRRLRLKVLIANYNDRYTSHKYLGQKQIQLSHIWQLEDIN